MVFASINGISCFGFLEEVSSHGARTRSGQLQFTRADVERLRGEVTRGSSLEYCGPVGADDAWHLQTCLVAIIDIVSHDMHGVILHVDEAAYRRPRREI